MLEGFSSMANWMGCCPSPEVLATMPLKTMMLSVKTNSCWCQLLPFQLSENRIWKLLFLVRVGFGRTRRKCSRKLQKTTVSWTSCRRKRRIYFKNWSVKIQKRRKRAWKIWLFWLLILNWTNELIIINLSS